MAYWMCVYSRSGAVMEREAIKEFFDAEEVVVDSGGSGADWRFVDLRHPDNRLIATIELRDRRRWGRQWITVLTTDAVEAERHSHPACNAEWVVEYLRGVETMYSFEVFDGVD